MGIGGGRTRGDERGVADQLYADYAEGVDLRRRVAIVGEEALTDIDRMALKFADAFEQNYLDQKEENRELDQTLELGWKLISMMPKDSIKRIKMEYVDKNYNPEMAEEFAAAES